MIKLPEYLQDKIYDLIVKNKQLGRNTEIEDILTMYADEFKKTRLTNKEIIRNIKTIKMWKFKKTKKRKIKEILNNEELIKQQQKELEVLKSKTKILKKEKQEADGDLTATRAKVKSYEVGMYLQKKAMNLYESIQSKIVLDGKEYKIDLFEGYMLQLLIRAKKETEECKKPEFGRLLLEALKENDKAMLFLQQQNISNNAINSDEINSLINSLNSKEEEGKIKEVENVEK